MDNSLDGLYAVFLEAVNGQQRAQWMLFPPASFAFGVDHDPEGAQRFMKRRLDKPGHRAKWKTVQKTTSAGLEEKLRLELDQYESTGWIIRQPVVIRLEQDDYEKVWANKTDADTPYKALRHVEAVTKKRGYRLV